METNDNFFIHPKAYWRVINFIESYCTHAQGPLAGQKIVIDTWMKWQIRTIFGRYDSSTHRRAIREAYLEIPKKNGKSLYLSAFGIYLLLADGYYDRDGKWIPEIGPSIITAASTREQARIIHDTSKQMVLNEPELQRRVTPRQHSIVIKDKFGTYKVISAEAGGAEGLNLSAALIDELHIHSDGGELYLALRGAGMARLQYLRLIITTAGVFDPTSIGWRKHEYAVKVSKDWKFDPHFHACIYAAEPEDDPFDPEVWAKANPNLGKSIDIKELEALALQAKNDPNILNSFKRYHLNIWVQSHSEWIPLEIYRACDLGTNEEENDKKPCWIGIDLASTNDLTAIARIHKLGQEWRRVRVEDDYEDRLMDIFSVKPMFFCTADKMDATKNNTQHVTYNIWGQNKLIEIAGDTDTDYIRVGRVLEEWINKYKVRSIGYDPHNAISMMQNLESKYKMKGPNFLNPVTMSPKELSPAMKYVQSLIHNRCFDHHGNPILEWMFANVMVKIDANDNIFPNKKQAKGKIDGIIAILCAFVAYLDDKYRDSSDISYKIEVV